MFAISIDTAAQGGPPKPPGPLKVTAVQGISFGAFSYASGTGTVTINPDGTRSASGVTLFELGFPYMPAVFNIVGNKNVLIVLTLPSNVLLSGPGGSTMELDITSTVPASPFPLTIQRPNPNILTVGGALTVGNEAANPPGSYTGDFEIVFNQP